MLCVHKCVNEDAKPRKNERIVGEVGVTIRQIDSRPSRSVAAARNRRQDGQSASPVRFAEGGATCPSLTDADAVSALKTCP
jgi:hypothetical protein